MEAEVYTQKGEKKGKVNLPAGVFGLKWNSDLVHQVVTSMLSSARNSTAHTKTRGEVSGGGKKPWRQKGTGRARHGSTRSPIWVGGGITHGPRSDKNYARKINKKMRAKALFTVLSRKFKDNEIVFIENLELSQPKTKLAKETLENWTKIPNLEGVLSKKRNSTILTIPERSESVERGFRNFGNLVVEEFRNLNPVTLLKYRNLIVINPSKSLEILNNKKIAKSASFVTSDEITKPKVKKVSKKKSTKA